MADSIAASAGEFEPGEPIVDLDLQEEKLMKHTHSNLGLIGILRMAGGQAVRQKRLCFRGAGKHFVLGFRRNVAL